MMVSSLETSTAVMGSECATILYIILLVLTSHSNMQLSKAPLTYPPLEAGLTIKLDWLLYVSAETACVWPSQTRTNSP